MDLAGMAPSENSRHSVNCGYYSVLDHEDDDVTDYVIDNDRLKANSKLSPVTILSKASDFVHSLCKAGDIKDYCLKKISIGVKIFFETSKSHDCLIRLLKERKCQFYSHENKDNKPFKIVLRGLENVSTDSVKHELTSNGFSSCTEVKSILKSYDHGTDTVFIVSFLKGSVTINDLRKNLRSMFHTIVKWDFHRKSKKTFVQCRNCQMFGHGEKFCNVLCKCLHCGCNHKSTDCALADSAVSTCANCKGNHKSNDLRCPSRACYAQIREQLKWRFRKSTRSLS